MQVSVMTNKTSKIWSAMVSNTEGVIDNSPNLPMTSTPVMKPSARKSLCLFTNKLDV